jgi:hypothetical protein
MTDFEKTILVEFADTIFYRDDEYVSKKEASTIIAAKDADIAELKAQRGELAAENEKFKDLVVLLCIDVLKKDDRQTRAQFFEAIKKARGG